MIVNPSRFTPAPFRLNAGRARRGLGDLIPYGAGTYYDTDTGTYRISGRPDAYTNVGALQAALYAPIIQSLAQQTPQADSTMIGPYSTVPEQRFYTLPDGTKIAESTYREALAAGTLPQLVHQYTGYGGAIATPGQVDAGAAPGAPAPSGAPAYLLGLRVTNTGAGNTTVFAPQIRLDNLNGRGNAFQVGDSWRVAIAGAAPGAAIALVSLKNNVNLGQRAMGSADAGGNFTLSGQMAAADIGAWGQVWFAGATALPGISFTLSPAAQAQTPQNPVAPPPRNPVAPAPSETPATAFSWTAPIKVGTYEVPLWGIGAALAAGYFLLSQKGR